MRRTIALLAAGVAGFAGHRALTRRRMRRSAASSSTRTERGTPLRVVIVGAGFGGLRLAQELEGTGTAVTLVDRNNYHLFQPLLYQVATAALEPEEIAHTVRGIFQKRRGVRFVLGEAVGVDRATRRLRLRDGKAIPYDRLVIAAGAETASFGVPGVDAYAFGLKHLEGAVALRSHVLRCFETAARDAAEIERGVLTFVIVGGGPTGVELAVALRELFDAVLRDDFPGLDVRRARIVLAERADTLLAGYSAYLRAYALRQVQSRGVEVRLGAAVERVEGRGDRARAVSIEGERIEAQTVLWAAGVKAAGIAEALGVEHGRGGRIAVGPNLAVPGCDGLFALGDIAAALGEDGDLLPQLAPVAQQQGSYLARRFAAEAHGEPVPTAPFRYHDKGMMATIGRGAAVAETPGGLRLTGYLAWQAWLWLHLMLLVGFRNRANVLVNWAYNYVTYDRAARLIIDRERMIGLLKHREPSGSPRSADPSPPSAGEQVAA